MGGEWDLTSGPVGKAVLLLAIPMVLEMVMESVFAICDVFFVSRLGIDAVACVGLTEAVITLLYAVAVGIGMATTAMVARRIGEGKPEAAADASVQSLGLGVVVSAVIALAGVIGAPELLRLMGGSEQVIAAGSGYVAWLFGGSSTIMLLFLGNAVFRGTGDAALAMRALWLANAINLVLDPCLIFGLGPFPQLGLTGAAVATTCGRGVGVVFQLWLLFSGRCRANLTRSHLRLRPGVMLRLLRVSFGGVLQFLIATASWVALMRIVGGFGSAAVAGYTIAIRIIVMTILPAFGVSNAAATLMGQNLGARQPDRAAASVWTASRYNVAFLLSVAAVFILGGEPLIRLFSSDAIVVAHGVTCLKVISCGYGFYGFGMVVVQAFNGAGDTTTPTLINLGCYWVFQLPMAYLLATGTALEVTGVFVAITMAESLLAVVAVVMFRQQRWRAQEI